MKLNAVKLPRQFTCCLLAIGGVMAATIHSGAAVSTVAYYRLGEEDPGAAAGQAANEVTVTSSGNVNLQRVGNATYSSETGVSGSQLALQVTGGGYTNGTPIVTRGDNWGLEAWVLSDTTTENRCIVYNGS